MIAWTWDSAAKGIALGGVVSSPRRKLVRFRIEQEMRRSGALSALAWQVWQDPDWGDYERTGAAMIATLADPHTQTIRWRNVCDSEATGK